MILHYCQPQIKNMKRKTAVKHSIHCHSLITLQSASRIHKVSCFRQCWKSYKNLKWVKANTLILTVLNANHTQFLSTQFEQIPLGLPFSYQCSFLPPELVVFANPLEANNTHKKFSNYHLFAFLDTDGAISSHIQSKTDYQKQIIVILHLCWLRSLVCKLDQYRGYGKRICIAQWTTSSPEIRHLAWEIRIFML